MLDHNLRNARQIANAFQPLVDHPVRFLGGEGPAVKFIACSQHDAMNAGDDEVELLLEEGWRPEDVALLTTGTRHPEQKERQAAGNAAYWDSFWDADQVFYGHVLGFKGLERRAVVGLQPRVFLQFPDLSSAEAFRLPSTNRPVWSAAVCARIGR